MFLSRIVNYGMHYSRSDIEAIASQKPAPATCVFAPEGTFDEDALAGLSGAARLPYVVFDGSPLSRANLLALADLPTTSWLVLRKCQFEGPDFVAFCEALSRGGSPKLTGVRLDDTPVGDEELRALAAVTRLKMLVLDGTRVTDAGLALLLSLTKLELLGLNRTQVSDAGVLALASLPKVVVGLAEQNGWSPDTAETFFRAQLALVLAKKKRDPAQLEAADAVLRPFLHEMEAWERSVWGRARAIEEKYKAARPYPSTLAPDEVPETEALWAVMNEEKAALVDKYCSIGLLARGAGRAGSYGDPPNFEAQRGDWMGSETPSPITTIFYGPGRNGWHRRYTLKLELRRWKVDEVQRWMSGWKRDMV